MKKEPLKLLTIGGSDSGGAAGIQADLKTWTKLGAYGMSAITLVTAQNSEKISSTVKLAIPMVYGQIEAVLLDYGAAAIKTGMLGRVDLINAITPILRTQEVVVVDPVLVRYTGEPLFGEDVAEAYRSQLFPIGTIITPNWREAALLSGVPITGTDDIVTAANTLYQMGAKNVIITGWLQEEWVLDVLFDGETMIHLRHKRIDTTNTHGSGDTFSAALTYWLGHGRTLRQSVEHAQQFTANALKKGMKWDICMGHGPLSHIRF